MLENKNKRVQIFIHHIYSLKRIMSSGHIELYLRSRLHRNQISKSNPRLKTDLGRIYQKQTRSLNLLPTSPQTLAMLQNK